MALKSPDPLYVVKRHQEVSTHIELLIAQNLDTFLFVVLDNASAHTIQKLAPFAQKHQHRLELVFLPTYSPHLNLIERLWRFMRGQMTRNHFFNSLSDQAETIIQWLSILSFSRFCSLMGIDNLSLNFS